nr:hypothetical protein [uncultured Oscillibacter sp.]
MVLMILGIGFALLPLLLRLALKLRLGIPLVYSILMLTVFHGWYQAHAALAAGILFAMVGIVALSWVVTLARKFVVIVSESLENMAAAKLLADRVRQARLTGESIVSTNGL